MIVVCGGIADSVTELVCSRLEACGYPYRLLDLGRYPDGFSIHAEWSNGRPEGHLACTIAGQQWSVDLSDITAVYARFLGAEGRIPLPGIDPDLHPAVHAEADTGLVALFEDLPCLVVNRYRGGMSNNSKPYQANIIQQCGLAVPETLVTNDPAEARRFFDEHRGEVIYKSLSGIRSIVRRLSTAQLDRLPLLCHGPAQFQACIPGDNVRVHVVGDRLFPTRIRSEAVDYRYARLEGHGCEMSEETLSPEVEQACVNLARRLDLPFAGIDLKITPSGEVFCFEVNPSPGFSFYEHGSGQPISAALADLLHAASTPAPTASRFPQSVEADLVLST